MCPEGAASGNESELFPYSISGFIAEPSQSAQRPRANPAAVQSIGLRLMRGTTVCVLFCEYRRTAECGPAQTRGAPDGVKRRCRPRVLFFPPCRLTVQDPGLSSRGMRVRLPSGRPFSLRKRRFSIRGRSPLRPLGSTRSQPAAQARQGPSLHVRAWRNSNVAVCQSAVPGAIPGARTNFGAVVFNSQHSGLLIRTVRVQLPPAPPNLNPRSLRTDVREVFSRRVT